MTLDVAEPGTVSRVAPGVLAIQTRTADGKIAAIAGDRSALAVDAGIEPREGEFLAAAIRSLHLTPDRLLYTHGHSDHVLGGGAFRGGLVLSHRDADAHLRRQIPTWAEAAGTDPATFAQAMALPNLVFAGDIALDLGGREVRVLTTPGHAPGAVCAYVPDARVLVGGDTVVTGIPPVFREGNSVALEATLRGLAGLEIDTVVPGHGPVVRGAAQVRAAILWAADYLARVRERVAGRAGRDDAEVIVAEVTFDQLIGERLPRERFRMEWRHEQIVRWMIAELAASHA